MTSSLCSLCRVPRVLNNRNWDEFSNYICLREKTFPLTYLLSSDALEPQAPSQPPVISVLLSEQDVSESLKTQPSKSKLQSFQWIKCLLGDFNFFNLSTQESYSNPEHFQSSFRSPPVDHAVATSYSLSHNTTQKSNDQMLSGSLNCSFYFILFFFCVCVNSNKCRGLS